MSPVTEKKVCPLPRNFGKPSPAPTTMFKKIIILNGIDEEVQTKYNSHGREYTSVGAGVRYYYTRDSLPSMTVKATPRKGSFNQVSLEVSMSLEDLVQALLKTSHPARYAVKQDRVDTIQTNFFPMGSVQDKQRTVVYLSQDKNVPLSTFVLDQECDVYLFPSTISYDRSKKAMKVRLAAIPVTSSLLLEYEVRAPEEEHDVISSIPSAELMAMRKIFLKKWLREDEVYDTEDVDSAIFG